MVEAHLEYLLRRDTAAIGAIRLIKVMETTIEHADAGDAPAAADWGALTATQFLRIVHDVTTWALTNFESFKAKPVSEDYRNSF